MEGVLSDSKQLLEIIRQITLTSVWIILDIMCQPNPIIVLLFIQNSDRCKKRFAIKRLGRLNFQTAAGHFVIFAALRWLRHQRPIIYFLDISYLAEMISWLRDIEN